MHTALRPRRAKPRSAQRGFTLVEAIISATLLGFLAVTATYFWVHNLNLVRTVNNDSAAVADGRATLERLAREVREIKYAGTVYCISTMNATTLVFNKTKGALVPNCGGTNPDATRNDIAVTIQYAGNVTAVNLGYAGSLATPAVSRAVTGQASAFAFEYLDQNLATTTSNVAIRFVKMTLTTRPPGGRATTTSTVVALRNE